MSRKSTSMTARALVGLIGFAGVAHLLGCQVENYLDPSKPLYGQYYPSSSPILDRIDAIERGDAANVWRDASDVQPEDLLPSDLEYRLGAGDIVTVEIYELLQDQRTTISQRRIDQSGRIRLPPPIRDLDAAGLTLRELEDAIIDFLDPDIIRDPIVTVNLDSQQGFSFTMAGSVPSPGTYPLTRPDLKLDQALGFAGGVPITTEYIYVTRPVPLSGDYEPFRNRGGGEGGAGGGDAPANGDTPVDIDDLLNDVEGGDGGVDPGVVRRDAGFDLNTASPPSEPRRVSSEPFLDIDDFNPSRTVHNRVTTRHDSFFYNEESGEWMRVYGQDEGDIVDDMLGAQSGEVVVERIIRVPYRKMLSDGSYNIVVRPGDRIYVEPPLGGVVYIGGEVARPGVYSLPARGKLTLSQLVTAAGGFGPLAIPSRVDFTRRVADDRDATIRLNLGAIRQKTEPDIFIKPDDHIIIGTAWYAAPLAVIRNGFRATYGFGFLLDRNFGPDVFGPPPRSRGL